jgi:hypothetical protein
MRRRSAVLIGGSVARTAAIARVSRSAVLQRQSQQFQNRYMRGRHPFALHGVDDRRELEHQLRRIKYLSCR